MRPLEDIRVLAIEQYGAGPFGSLHLADLGADVIKIEDPTTSGDVGRYVPPFQQGEDSLFFETFNRNKRSINLDLGSDSGREVFERLVPTADAVYSNLRGDVPAKMGLTYRDLSDLNPRIVCLSLSGFGMEGPFSHLPGYDYIYQAMTGWMSLTGEPDGPPTKTGLSLVDFTGGIVAATTLLAAVHVARRDGKGMDCDLSLYDVAMSLLTYQATWAMGGNWEPQRMARSAHPSLVPFQLFQGSDEGWFVLGCAKEKFWKQLVEELEDPRLRNERFSGFAARRANREEVVALLDEIFARRPAADWVDWLQDAGIPAGLVESVEGALAQTDATRRDLIVEFEHDQFGTTKALRSAVRVGTDRPSNRRAPKRGENTFEILAELGYSVSEIEAMTASETDR